MAFQCHSNVFLHNSSHSPTRSPYDDLGFTIEVSSLENKFVNLDGGSWSDKRPKIPTPNNLKLATGNLSQFNLMPANDRAVLVVDG